MPNAFQKSHWKWPSTFEKGSMSFSGRWFRAKTAWGFLFVWLVMHAPPPTQPYLFGLAHAQKGFFTEGMGYPASVSHGTCSCALPSFPSIIIYTTLKNNLENSLFRISEPAQEGATGGGRPRNHEKHPRP